MASVSSVPAGIGRSAGYLPEIHLPVMAFGIRALRTRWPAIFPPAWTLATGLAAVGVVAACVALSAVAYRLIERPFLVRKARVEL